jgi:adenylate kinase
MRVTLTGTPGTGKTTVADLVETDLTVVHLNEVVEREGLYGEVDEDRDSFVVDLDRIRERFAGRDDLLVESHLAHHLPAERTVVLRCHPEEVKRRLRERGESAESAAENAESEALDLVLAEAVDREASGEVYEIDTTDRAPDEVAREVEAVVEGRRRPSAGEVSFVDYL